MSALSLDATYAAIRGALVGIVVPVDVVSVSGPETIGFLQGQVSQDIGALEVGGAVETLLLSPAGKLDAYARLMRNGEEEALLVVDEGVGGPVLERLGRFKLRVRAELQLSPAQAALLRGPGATEAATGPVRLPVTWPGEVGCDLVGADVELPEGVPIGDPEGFEAARIEAGRPLMGRELTERTIPQEAGIVERTVSFNKGCFTGQELVARIDARGNRVPRRLVGLVVDGPVPDPGDVMTSEGREVGSVTSAAYSPGSGAPVALGYLARGVEVTAPVEVRHDGTALAASASDLPLYRS